MAVHYHAYSSVSAGAEMETSYARKEDAIDLVKKWGIASRLVGLRVEQRTDVVHYGIRVHLTPTLTAEMDVQSCAKASCPSPIGWSPRE